MMTFRLPLFWALCYSLFGCQTSPSQQEWLLSAPAGEQYCTIDEQGSTVLPNGRIIKPLGDTYRIAPHPYGLVLSPDGTTVVTANSGTRPFSLSILREVNHQAPRIQQVPEGALNAPDLLGAVFMGLAISEDNQTLYASGGQENLVYVFDLPTGVRKDSIVCSERNQDGRTGNGYLGDMKLDTRRNRLYVVDQIGFAVLVIDLKSQQVIQRVPVGRYPFGLGMSPDGNELYVANVGMFEYQRLDQGDEPLDYPAFGYQTEAMQAGTLINGQKIPGLGSPNVPESFSVWCMDLRGEQVEVTAKIKTGIQVGEKVEGIPAIGGSSPNSIVATDRYVFVSNGNNDCISVIDPKQDKVIRQIPLQPDARLGHLRGIIPFGLAISPDQKRLYVAESGLNAIGIIDLESFEVIGHLPVGWFPSKLAVSPDGTHLFVANAKGYGSGPNGGKDFQMGEEGSYIGHLMKGSLTRLAIPTDEELPEYSGQVIENNFHFYPNEGKQGPVPSPYSKKSSPIKHLVFISKENRTYDEVFGQLKDGKGDPSLARYGLNASFSNAKGTAQVEHADVMVNHLALARQFAISDNFYVDADHSADGHRWLVNTYPNEWVETHVSAAYGGKRSAKADSEAPGNLGLVGSSGAIYPEDYNEAGSIWDHFARNHISFFNFGFGMEFASSLADSTMKYTGVKYLVNFPLPGPLYDHSSRQYATYNMAIPDQFRADQFMREFDEKWGEGKAEMPQVLTILLPNDHGAGDRPHAGYPFRESYMMDNDLALGRIVEFLSQTPYWKNMAIVVTEDDSQNGVDHIDAHRSLLMLISPWAKKGYVGHQHYSFGSIFKTFWHILGVPYLNQYDAGATDLADLFTDEPDFSPYYARPVDERVFDPQKVLDPFDEKFDWKAVIESPDLDDPALLQQEAEAADQARELERNRQSNPIRNQ